MADFTKINKTPPITPERLERAALSYLERFAASTASLRRVLTAKVDRSAREHDTDRTEGKAWIEALITRYQQNGVLDDARYAEAKASRLRRQGASSQAIRGQLAARGIPPELAAAGLAYADETEAENTELTAAHTLARRRRLGPYRPANDRATHRTRDLAVLGRAGFSYETARQVIDAEPESP